MKSNIGHLSQAAGIVGVIKAVLALEHGLIPPTLNFETPNPGIDFADTPFYVANTLTKWDTDGWAAPGRGQLVRHRRHQRARGARGGAGGVPRRTPASGRRSCCTCRRRPRRRWTPPWRGSPSTWRTPPTVGRTLLADVAHTLRVGRQRVSRTGRAVVAADAARGGRRAAHPAPPAVRRRSTARAPGVAFLFSGQGAQYAGHGRASSTPSEPAFAAAVDECADAAPAASWAWTCGELILRPRIRRRREKLAETRYTQPALFTVEYALALLWRSWGVQPGGDDRPLDR